jgi:hypothetical protein
LWARDLDNNQQHNLFAILSLSTNHTVWNTGTTMAFVDLMVERMMRDIHTANPGLFDDGEQIFRFHP